jgi:hypothetical protein
MAKNTRRMTLIPEPAPNTQAILSPTLKGPVMWGKGPLSYMCGFCATTLLQDVEYKQVQNIVIKCFGCGAFNELPADCVTAGAGSNVGAEHDGGARSTITPLSGVRVN